LNPAWISQTSNRRLQFHAKSAKIYIDTVPSFDIGSIRPVELKLPLRTRIAHYMHTRDMPSTWGGSLPALSPSSAGKLLHCQLTSRVRRILVPSCMTLSCWLKLERGRRAECSGYSVRDTETFGKEVSRSNVHDQLMKSHNLNSREDLKPAHRPELEATTHIFTQSRWPLKSTPVIRTSMRRWAICEWKSASLMSWKNLFRFPLCSIQILCFTSSC
jgi:hypothetical protein